MANIALDIKANTTKALGEFKKLSRELDNKFLVQGIKLDVVKNAFREITKEFDSALGEQGFKSSESTNQLQRNAAANLAALNKLGIDAAISITENVTASLRDLEAQGTITNEALRETLNVSGFFEFGGTDDQIAAQFDSFSRRFAQFATDTKDIFGESGAGQLQKVVTGQASIDSLLGLDFGAGGAGSNVIAKYLREKAGGDIRNVSAETRTRIVNQLLIDIKDANTEIGQIFAKLGEKARTDDPFRFFKRDIAALFSPTGTFGALKVLTDNKEFTDLAGNSIPRNLLQLTVNLLRTIFDKKDGVFAILYRSLQEVFGLGDPLAPILAGVEIFTRVVESIGNFFGSGAFKNFLRIFTPIVDAISSIDPEKMTIDLKSINAFIDGIGDGIRGFIGKLTKYISDLDTGSISSILANILDEIARTIPPLIGLIFTSLGKLLGAAFDTFLKADAGGKLLLAGGALVLFRKQIFSAVSGLVGAVTGLFNVRGGIANLLDRRRGPGSSRLGNALRGFEGQVLLKLDTIIRILGGDILPGRGGTGGGRRRFSRREVNQRFQRRFNRNVPRGARFARGIGRFFNRIPGFNRLSRLLGAGLPAITTALRGIRPQFSQFRAGFGTTANTARGFNVAVGAGSPGRAFNIGQGLRNLPTTISKSFSGVVTKLSGAGDKITLISRNIASDSSRLFRSANRNIRSISSLASSSLTSLFRSSTASIASLSSRASRSITSLLGRAPQLAANAGPALSTGTNRIVTAFRGVSSRITDLLARGSRSISSVGSTARAGLNNLFANTSASLSRSFNSLSTRVSSLLQRGSRSLTSISRTVSTRIGSIFTSASNGLRSMANTASRATTEVAKRAPQIASRAAQAASRAGQAARSAVGGIASRGGNLLRGAGGGLRRLGGPLLTTLLGGFAIADILGREAKGEELEGLTPEQKREKRRQDERGKTRGVLGVLGGIGGGALAGAGVGAALGAAGANPLTVAIGGALGSIVGGIIGEEAVKVLGDNIIDGVTDFAKNVGGWFSDTWSNISGGWNSALKAIGDFLGKDGPIQRFGRFIGGLFQKGADKVGDFFGEEGPIQTIFGFVTSLPGEIVENIKTSFETIKEKFTELPGKIWDSLSSGFGSLFGLEKKDGKFLGGVGSGMTLVGENGPELVNLGSGSVVTPMTSFAGLGLSGSNSVAQPVNNVVINVNAPGADEFADQLSIQVIEKLDELFEEQKASQGK